MTFLCDVVCIHPISQSNPTTFVLYSVFSSCVFIPFIQTKKPMAIMSRHISCNVLQLTYLRFFTLRAEHCMYILCDRIIQEAGCLDAPSTQLFDSIKAAYHSQIDYLDAAGVWCEQGTKTIHCIRESRLSWTGTGTKTATIEEMGKKTWLQIGIKSALHTYILTTHHRAEWKRRIKFRRECHRLYASIH